jgi:predicted chitinase
MAENTQPTAYQKEFSSNLGNIPYVYYNGSQIDVGNIETFRLFYKKGIPYLKITFYDGLNLMRDKTMPLDDSKIKIFMNPKSNQLKEILLQFKIINFSVSGASYTLTGVIDVDLLHVIQYKSYSKMTSHKALQQVARDCGLGFNTNIDDTADEMTWINSGNYVYDFVEEIVDNSYKSDTSFLVYFIDYYYNFNFIDVAKELERDVDEQLGISDKSLAEAFNELNKDGLTNLLLSNDYSFENTNQYFDSYKIINNSTLVSLNSGYRNIVKYYDELEKDFLIFNIESLTSQTGNNIILKGQPEDNNFFNLNTNTYYLGKFDSDNVHKNYSFAFAQNDKNLFDLQKFALEITMKNPNYSVYKYQKIKLIISNQTATPSADFFNNRLSGDWLITDIEFIFENGKYTQKIKLIKRELDLSKEELDSETPITLQKEVGENTSNPEVPTNPNPLPPPESAGGYNSATASAPLNSIVTKDIWRQIYQGRIKPQIIETMYNSVVGAMEQYQINTPSRIAAFLSQINIETSYLRNVTELSSGSQYNNNQNLGNGPNDGITYKGRGLIQLTGKKNYKTAGNYLNQDFVNNPTTVSADNKTHIAVAATPEQLSNTSLVSVIYWLKISSWGNLNNYADSLNIKTALNTNGKTPPNSQSQASSLGYNTKKNNNFATDVNGDSNLVNFTLICFGVNGGYNGYSDRINEYNRIRQYFA